MNARLDRRRRRASVALVVVTALLLAAAAVSWYARSALVDERDFSSRAAAALDDSDLRTVMADRVVGVLTRNVATDLQAVRPLLVPAVAALADTSTFRRVFARAVSDRHRALINGETTFSFELPVGEGLVFESLSRVAPRVAGAIPPDLRVPVLRLDPRNFELTGARLLGDLAGWRWALLLGALLAAAGCALLAGGARTALVYLGVAAAGGGLIVAAGVTGLGEYVVAHAAQAVDLSDESERGAVRALWMALFSDLLTAALVVALGGAVVAALASRRSAAVDLATSWMRVRRVAGAPGRPARLAKATALIALGAAIVFEPALLGRIAVIAAGLLIVLIGVAQLSGAEAPAGAASERPGSAGPLLLAGAVAAALAATALAVALVLPAPTATPAESAGRDGDCNGSPALCDRRLNDVAFAATHNSYAAADEPGWFFANQRYGIERQLRDGIRAFLIDIHYGVRDEESGRIRTDLTYEGSSRNKIVQQLSPRALRTADRLAGRVGIRPVEGPRRLYLCHTLCELGAEPLDEQLEIFAAFLEANPGEVLLLFVEPYVPVDEVERALDQAGLLEQAAEISRDKPLPTLGRLVQAGTRLVVLAEKDGGARPWYLDGFSFVQDTPLGATTPEQLRCGRNRGQADSPLFLVNHWIPPYPPSVSRNDEIAGDALERRLERCERNRGLLPNLLAVDFHERSGVVDAAERLNAQKR
jgi:hypothetical protein